LCGLTSDEERQQQQQRQQIDNKINKMQPRKKTTKLVGAANAETVASESKPERLFCTHNVQSEPTHTLAVAFTFVFAFALSSLSHTHTLCSALASSFCGFLRVLGFILHDGGALVAFFLTFRRVY